MTVALLIYATSAVLVTLAVAGVVLAWQDVATDIRKDDWSREGGLRRF